VRRFQHEFDEGDAEFLKANAGKSSEMIPVGRKGRDFFKRREMTLSKNTSIDGAGQVKHQDAVEIANHIIRTFTEDETIDKVYLFHTN
jgi:F0F1-type ATP synthase gamma subunit